MNAGWILAILFCVALSLILSVRTGSFLLALLIPWIGSLLLWTIYTGGNSHYFEAFLWGLLFTIVIAVPCAVASLIGALIFRDIKRKQEDFVKPKTSSS